MIAQIRMYTINRGQMDTFLAHFKAEILPLHERVGLPVVASYVNRPQNEFIWVRTFADEADREAKQKAFTEAAAAAGLTLGTNVAKMEIRNAEMAFPSA
ncbi:MAG TPA: NIPSNAP family protein [Chloroflexota bacterium]|jgi:hypothetical protein